MQKQARTELTSHMTSIKKECVTRETWISCVTLLDAIDQCGKDS